MAQAKRKQKFFDVEIPIIQKTTQLRAFELEDLNGKFIKYDLTRLLRGKSMILSAIVKVQGDKAIAIPRKTQILPYVLKRMVRKGTRYVEDSFDAECADAKLRIKPFLVTRRRVSRKVRKALREKAKEELIAYVKEKTSVQLFEELLDNRIQKPLSLKLKKIYPLSTCEIRVMQATFNEDAPKKEIAKAKEEKSAEEVKEKPAEKKKDSKKETTNKKE